MAALVQIIDDGGLDGVLVLGRCRFVFEADDVHAGRVDVDLDLAMFNRDLRSRDTVHMGVHFTGVLCEHRRGEGRGGKGQMDRFHDGAFRG